MSFPHCCSIANLLEASSFSSLSCCMLFETRFGFRLLIAQPNFEAGLQRRCIIIIIDHFAWELTTTENFLQIFSIFFIVSFWIEVRINTHPPTTHSSCKLQILIAKLWIFPSLIEWDVKRFLKRLELFVVVTWIWITVCCFFDQISYLFSLSLPPHSFEHLSSFWGFLWQEQNLIYFPSR